MRKKKKNSKQTNINQLIIHPELKKKEKYRENKV